MKEFEFLEIISKNLDNSKYLGDDCAYLKDFNIAISADSLIEDVHFSFKYMKPFEVAQKAMLVNISDILASGAKPKYALITLSGKLTNDFINEFYLGIGDICKKYDIKIIGGDLTKADKISITVTILGDIKKRNLSKRSNSKKDYVVGAVGVFGKSAIGLKELIEGKKQSENIEIHKYPKLYPNISKIIATKTKKPYAMMDSSDGLFDCLYQISKKSKVKININFDKIQKINNDKDLTLFGGEDYNLVFCLDEKDFKNIQKKCPEIYEIGRCYNGNGVFLDNIEIKENRSFNHFDK